MPYADEDGERRPAPEWGLGEGEPHPFRAVRNLMRWESSMQAVRGTAFGRVLPKVQRQAEDVAPGIQEAVWLGSTSRQVLYRKTRAGRVHAVSVPRVEKIGGFPWYLEKLAPSTSESARNPNPTVSPFLPRESGTVLLLRLTCCGCVRSLGREDPSMRVGCAKCMSLALSAHAIKVYT